jgi:hypothetical protein
MPGTSFVHLVDLHGVFFSWWLPVFASRSTLTLMMRLLTYLSVSMRCIDVVC